MREARQKDWNARLVEGAQRFFFLQHSIRAILLSQRESIMPRNRSLLAAQAGQARAFVFAPCWCCVLRPMWRIVRTNIENVK